MSLYHRLRHDKTNKMKAALDSTVRNYLWTNPSRGKQSHKRIGASNITAALRSALGALFGLLEKVFVRPAVLIALASIILVSSIIGGGTALCSSLIYDVTLSLDSTTVAVRCVGGTVGDMLERYSIELSPHDSIDPPVSALVSDGMEITLRRAQTVYIWDGSKPVRTEMLVSGTVRDALDQAGISLNQDDEVFPDIDTMIFEGLEIAITRVEYAYESLIVEIPYNTVTKKTDELPLGETRVSAEGQTGATKKLIQNTLENGETITSRIVNEEVLEKPTDRVVLSGTYVAPTPAPTVPVANPTSAPTTSTASAKSSSSSKETVKSSSKSSGGVITVNGKSISYKTVYNGKATAYTHTGRNTATGTKPGVGTVAVDPKVIPLGTRLYIPNYGFARAEDTGDSVIRNYTIDLFFETREECIQWGVKSIKIYILD